MRLKWTFAIAFLAAWPAAAQYPPAKQLNQTPVTFTGRVTRVEWINPNTWIHMDVPGPGGAESWLIAMAGVGMLKHLGVTEDRLKIGDVVSIEVLTLKDGTPRAFYRQGGVLTLNSGAKVQMPFWSASALPLSPNPNHKPKP